MSEQVTKFDEPIWKKWSNASGISRFLSIKPWYEAKKFNIDIGQSKDGHVTSNTQIYLNMGIFVTTCQYLVDVSNLNPQPKFGSYHKQVVYGGSVKDNNIVSRVFSIDPFGSSTSDSLMFRSLSLVGQKTSQGAIVPIKPNKILSDDSIKVTAFELRQILYATQCCVNSYMHNNSSWGPFDV